MRSNGYGISIRCAALVAVAVVCLTAVQAMAQPNAAIIKERIFNDCPTSVLTSVNNYPMLVAIDDDVLDCTGFANLHVWRFSDDGGMSEMVFNNGDGFRFGAELTVSGTAEGEAGLQIAPWWSQDVDGRFNVRTTDGEIACFGGRLPFYSFSGSQNLFYTKGETIYLEMKYLPNGLSETEPGTIEYILTYDGNTYTSGVLPFDEGNPQEPYGTWGILDDARAGGHVQPFLQAGNPDAGLRAEWGNIVFEDLGGVPVEPGTWGYIKSIYSR
ncbi:MAG: hypothetical protein PVF43_02100 [Candidatus Eiseniibacteriota bacterium]|jgi:hypothetical protein